MNYLEREIFGVTATNLEYKAVRHFGGLYGTTILYGGMSMPSFYEEQRFGINEADKLSYVRRNFIYRKCMSVEPKSIESLVDHPNKFDLNSSIDMNKTVDDADDHPLDLGDKKASILQIDPAPEEESKFNKILTS